MSNPEIQQQQSPEHARMQQKMEIILTDPNLLRAARADSIFTFKKLGLDDEQAGELFEYIRTTFVSGSDKSLEKVEEAIFEKFTEIQVDENTLVEKLDDALSARAKLIVSQVVEYLDPSTKVFDFGTGDGDVSYNLRKNGFEIAAATDVTDYRKPAPDDQEPLPFQVYDGESLPYTDKEFSQSLMTNVAHHAGETVVEGEKTKGNNAMLEELCRVTADRIVVIETIPDPSLIRRDGLETAHERTRWNDYLYNRLFHARVGDNQRTNIPVPGRYETAEGWVERFSNLGWKAEWVEHLEYDQPSIRDYHILYIFERDPDASVVPAATESVRNDIQERVTTTPQ